MFSGVNNIIIYLQENCFKTSNAKRVKFYEAEIKAKKKYDYFK